MLVVADTHLAADTVSRMPHQVWALAEAADVVLHAGDVLDRAVLDAFASCAPTHAVLGNNDHVLLGTLPEELELELAGVAVAVVHDSGPTAGRAARLARRFPAAQVVVFGHSHDPVVAREGAGPWLVNPGSPVQRRRQPVHSVAWLELAHGEVVRAEVVPVGPRADPAPVAALLASVG